MIEHPKSWAAQHVQRIVLDDGHAENMGEGMFVVFQTIGERTFSVTLSTEDMAKMLAVG